MEFLTKQENTNERQRVDFSSGSIYVVAAGGNEELRIDRLRGYVFKITPSVPYAFFPLSKSTLSSVYSSEQILSSGGIDALSVAIGNNKSLKAPSVEFTDEEWAQMCADLDNDE